MEEVKYEKVRFAGLREPDSIWRGPPSSILDEAWDNVTWKGSHYLKGYTPGGLANIFSTVPEIPADESVIHRTNNPFDINSLTRFPPEFGGQIYTEVEWKHQLHCLVRELKCCIGYIV